MVAREKWNYWKAMPKTYFLSSASFLLKFVQVLFCALFGRLKIVLHGTHLLLQHIKKRTLWLSHVWLNVVDGMEQIARGKAVTRRAVKLTDPQ